MAVLIFAMKHHYKNEISLFRALICQDCKRKLGEATDADYQIMLICRRCKKLNTFHS
nr:MAG TPA: putative integral membrane zinc-ribbon metal-binding protein [Caudoviricetes sp.]